MIDAFDHWVHVPVKTKGFHDAENALRATTQSVSDQLAALGLGYHLEADVLVDAPSRTTADLRVPWCRGRVRPCRRRAGCVLSLRRLDHLNLTHTLLGMQTMELGDPVVLLDQIEDFVARRVAPVLGEGRGDGFAFGAPFPLGDGTWFNTRTGLDLSIAATEAIRKEIAPIAARDGVGGLQRAVIATVRRHEARHGLDNDRDQPLRYPAALAAHVGAETPATRRLLPGRPARSSAYTSQIASDPVMPQLAVDATEPRSTRIVGISRRTYVAITS